MSQAMRDARAYAHGVLMRLVEAGYTVTCGRNERALYTVTLDIDGRPRTYCDAGSVDAALEQAAAAVVLATQRRYWRGR